LTSLPEPVPSPRRRARALNQFPTSFATAPSIAGTRFYREPSPDDEAALKAYSDRLLSLLNRPLSLVEGKRNELTPRRLPLSPEAAAEWKLFHDNVEGQSGRNGELHPIRDFAAKAPEHAARIAGVLTLVEKFDAAEIPKGAMGYAIDLVDWYIQEALRLYGSARTDDKLLRADSLLQWLKGRGKSEIDLREMQQFGPGALRTKDALQEAIGLLVGHGWLIVITQGAYRRATVLRP
jgi:hypothetical protein